MSLKIKSGLKQRDLDRFYLRVEINGEFTNRCLTDIDWSEVEEFISQKTKKESENEPNEITCARYCDLMTRIAAGLHEALRSLGDGLDIYTTRSENIPKDAEKVKPGSVSIVHEHSMFDMLGFSREGAISSIAEIDSAVNRLTQQMNDIRNVLFQVAHGAEVGRQYAHSSLESFDGMTRQWIPQMLQSAELLKKIIIIAAQSKTNLETESDSAERTIDHHCPICNAPVYKTHPIGLCTCEWPEHKIEEYSRILDEFSSTSTKVN